MLINLLADANVMLSNYEALATFLPEKLKAEFPVVFILPIRGDIDLLEVNFAQLKAIAQHPHLFGRTLVFVLHGDRHVWDQMRDTYPIYAKLKAMFFYSCAFSICPEKLDVDSIDIVARYVIEAIRMESCAQESRIATIACMLNKRPQWLPHEKHLGFYDGTTGQSQLTSVPHKTADAILNLTQELELNSLELNHAALDPEQLNGQKFTANKIDFIGNRLDFNCTWATCPRVEWINLAANGLAKVDIGQCPPTLQHLYLHKNAIHTIHVPTGLSCRLRSLSIYRNCLMALDLPSDQTDLIKLNIGANPISELPETLQNARGLEFLGLARTSLRELPSWLFEMPQLKEVDLSHMQHLIPARQIQALASRGVNIILEPGKKVS